MAKSVLDIVIKIAKQGDADRQTIKGLAQLKSSIMDAAAVAGTLVAAGYALKTAFDATVGSAVALADKVRSIKEVTGLSAEESSKLIQITDDLKISYEDLYKVMQKNGDQYDYSISGLARMSDEYLSLSDANEKAKYMQDRFGKSWGDFVELMEQGSGRIIAAGEGINEALILDENALRNAREYEKQIDELADSWEALKVSAGNKVLPATVTTLEKLNAEIAEENGSLFQLEKGWRMLLGPIGAVWNLIDLLGNETNELEEGTQGVVDANQEEAMALEITEQAAKDLADEIQELSKANAGLINDAIKITERNKDYQASQDEIINQIAELKAKKEAMYPWEIEQIGETQQKIDELGVKYEENAQQFVEAMQEKFAMMAIEKIALQDGIEGFSQAEYEKARAILETQDIATAAAFEEQQAMEMLTDALVNGTIPNVETFGSILEQVTSDGVVSVNEVTSAINAIPPQTNVAINVHTSYTNSGTPSMYGTGYWESEKGYAEGTHGWETVPPGYPNDSYPIWLTSGEEFAVIPPSGSTTKFQSGITPTQEGSSSGSAQMNISVIINSVINTADREKTKQVLAPVFDELYRNALTRGVVR